MPVQRLTWRDGGREDTFINKTQIITKYCNIGQNACAALHNIWRKKHKRLFAFKSIEDFGVQMGTQCCTNCACCLSYFVLKGVIQSVKGSETCIVDTSLLRMMWQNINTEPVVYVNGCTGENLLSTKLRRRRQWSHLNHAAYKSHWRADNPQQFAAPPEDEEQAADKWKRLRNEEEKKRLVFVMTSHH